MQLVAVLIMLVGGGALAALVLTAMAIGRAERRRSGPVAAPNHDSVAVSLLFHILCAGGCEPGEALRQIRRETGLAAAPVPGIDVTSWAASYAGSVSPRERSELLETAVKLVAGPGRVLPLRQYAALLDLSFGLGFQTDALGRLRAVYGFDYVDHAKDARPRSADRAGGGAPLFERSRRSPDELCRILGVEAEATAQEIGAAYRRLASQHHPDRYHGASAEEESAAAARFIEITTAYEELMVRRRE